MIERLVYVIPLTVLLWVSQNYQNLGELYLDRSAYIVSDTSKYEHFMLRLINRGDSLAIIEDVHVSCGCTMATLQRAVAVKNNPGLIYVGITSDKIDTLQPITVDVTTNRNRGKPFRCSIVKRSPRHSK